MLKVHLFSSLLQKDIIVTVLCNTLVKPKYIFEMHKIATL